MVPHSFIPLSFTLHRLTGNQEDIEFCGDVCQFEKKMPTSFSYLSRSMHNNPHLSPNMQAELHFNWG